MFKPLGGKEVNMDEKTKEALKEIYENLTDEQKEKVKTCKDMDELMKLAGEWGMELPDELVDTVSGGVSCDKCPDVEWYEFYTLWGMAC